MIGQVLVLRFGEQVLDVALAVAREPALEPDEPRAVTNRERTEHHGVDRREEGRVEADAERERQDGRRREPGMPCEQPRCVADVVENRFDAGQRALRLVSLAY